MLAQVVIVADHFMEDIEETGGVASVHSRKHMVDLGVQRLSHYKSSAVLVLSWIPAVVFWPYFFGLAISGIGLPGAIRGAAGQTHALDKAVQFGPLLFAIAMAIFGADHFTSAKFVATIVPSWIPWHLFWAYFVGVALIAGALGLVTNKQAGLAAALLGIMIFLFVLLIHVPNCFAKPHDRARYTLLLRDLALSSGVCAFAASRTEQWRTHGTHKIITAARFVMAITAVVFGVEQFMYPHAAPGIPQDDLSLMLTMASWIPGHVFWAYLSGAVLVACGVGLMTKRRARLAAGSLGIWVVFLMFLVYLPLVIAKPSDIANGLNYLAIHSALGGAALFLAGALTKEEHPDG
jgi:uncharacterized membrane protein